MEIKGKKHINFIILILKLVIIVAIILFLYKKYIWFVLSLYFLILLNFIEILTYFCNYLTETRLSKEKSPEELRKRHLKLLEEDIPVDSYIDAAGEIKETERNELKKEVQSWGELSLQMFEQLKKEGHHKLENMYDKILSKNKLNIDLSVNNHFKKIRLMDKMTKLQNDAILEGIDLETLVILKIWLYMWCCEAIWVMFEMIIRSIQDL